MLKEITLENFKALERVTMNPSRITVLIGPNGAGKSSLFQALALLKQSREQDAFITNGLYVRIGEFADFVTAGATRRRVSFRIGLDATMPSALSPEMPTGSVLCTYQLEIDNWGLVSHKTQYDLPDQRSLRCAFDFKQKKGTISPEKLFPRVDLSPGGLVCVPLFVSSTDPHLYRAAKGLRDIILEYLENIFIIPTERAINNPSYPQQSLPGAELLTPEQVANFFVYKSEARKQLSEWLSRLLGEDLELDFHLKKGESEIVIDVRRRESTNVRDEGSGLHHVLWPLAQLVAAPSKSLVAIKEPEIHLHPRAQAQLSDVLVDVAVNDDKELMITTQSEHMLMRFLTRVAEGKLATDDLAIYYFKKKEAGVVDAVKLHVDEEGRIEGGLKGFFEADVEELAKFIEALARKRSQ